MSKAKKEKVERSDYLYRKERWLYFRMADGALVPLPSDENSKAFEDAYDECLAVRVKLKKQPTKLPKNPDMTNVLQLRDTIADGIVIYKQSTDYRDGTKSSTKAKYNRWLAILSGKLGTTRLRDLDVNGVDLYSEMIATEKSPSNARFQVAMISNVWDACKKHKQFGLSKSPNPTLGAESRYKVKTPHLPWSDDLQDRFMQLAPKSLQLAKLLLHFSAQRGGDCVKFRVRDFDGAGLMVTPEKTADGSEVQPYYCKCPEPLRVALEERYLDSDDGDEFILINEKGRPWASANSLSCSIRDFMIKHGLRQKGSKAAPLRGPSMHGLRKNAASEVAALLVGTQGIKSITLHKSDDQAAYYAKHAAQRALNETVVDKWDAALVEKKQRRVDRRRASIRRVK